MHLPRCLPQTNVQAPKQAAKPPRQKPRAVAREAAPVGPVQAPLSPEAQAAAQLAAKNASSIRRAEISLRPPARPPTTIGHDTIQDLPGGHQPNRWRGAAAGPRRFAGFRSQRLAACPQRSRQSPVPDQRDTAARRRPPASAAFSTPASSAACHLVTGALPAEYGLRTTGLVDITTRTDLFNNSGQRRCVWRQPWNDHPEHRIWRHVRQQLPGDNDHARWQTRRRRPPRIALPASNITSPAAIPRTRWASKTRPPPIMRFTISRSRTGALPICPTFVDPTTRVSLIAGTSYNNFQIPNVPGRRSDRAAYAGHQCIRRDQF